MTARGIKPIIATVASVLIMTSCLEIEKLPPEPRIEFRSFVISDTTDILGNDAKAGKLTFYFEDGDGDIGLSSGYSGVTETHNLFLVLYRKTEGVMLPAEPLDPLYPSPYRIPHLERLGQNKILKGEITVTILYDFYETGDTIMYDFYVRDRATNESNIESTCEIPVAVNGIYTGG
ncbi:MAG: hypothetical protein R6W67_05865 [Bacteroidales bacterium]